MWNATQLGLSLVLAVMMFHEPFTLRRRIAAVLLLAAVAIVE
jgi:multidrug transporter EmrE-like cation transporter